MTTKPEQYSEVVARLQKIVDSLEGGELSLEQSLETFAEGVQLVKKGEKLLGDAEKRIEQLLSEDGRTAPIELEPAAKTPSARKPEPPKAPARAVPEDDVPF